MGLSPKLYRTVTCEPYGCPVTSERLEQKRKTVPPEVQPRSAFRAIAARPSDGQWRNSAGFPAGADRRKHGESP